MLETIRYVFLGLFVLTSLFHLVVAFLESEHLRKITKPICLFFLSLFALFALPQHPLIYIGAILGMIGDILLINNKNTKFFFGGAVMFLLGHFCYISEVLFVVLKVDPVAWWFYVVVAFALLLVTLAFYPFAKGLTKNRYLALIGNLYLGVLVLVIVVSSIASAKGYQNFMVLGILGGISFLVSDLLLTKATFMKDFPRRDYYIMLFYFLGQGFIVLALTLTQLFPTIH